MYHLSEINIYPVKSLRGITVDSRHIDAFGLHLDRRWMLIDEQNKFLTQRQEARMSLIDVALTENGLVLNAPAMPACTIPGQPQTTEVLDVQVWKDTVQAIVVNTDIDKWLSQFLGRNTRLVYMPDRTVRLIDQDYSISKDDQVGFADGFPFLLISQASLDDLNHRLEQKGESAVPMHRFRPNLVISDCTPYEEDSWETISIGSCQFHVVKPCSRCIIPTIDRDTAEKGKEPVRTLLEYRRTDNKIYFGQNLVHELQQDMQLSTGDVLTIVARKNSHIE